ncbi:MAG: ABC transporter permease, partial [Proteobacteria bacterium]|nr:ABC transporter permease [Pseudomonadota bacterium]
DSSNSVVGSAGMISKVYFPRLVLPASAVTVGLVDLVVPFFILLGMLAWYGHAVSWRILLLPGFLLLAVMAALGLGLILCALNVRYRDVRHLLPFLIQSGLYLSPVGFSSSVVPAKWQLVYSLNPMVGVIDGFRWAVLGGDVPLYLPGLLASGAIGGGLLVGGVHYFRRAERRFADVI